jgi:hypothetical protein
MKRCSLQNRVSKFTPKLFMRLTPANVGLGWKRLTATNTLAYYILELITMLRYGLITALKSFIAHVPYSKNFISFVTFKFVQ